MSTAIQFLETLGRVPLPALRTATASVRDVGLQVMEEDQKQALMDLDAGTLANLLGGRAKMMMQIWAPTEETPDSEEQEDKDGDGEPDQSPDK